MTDELTVLDFNQIHTHSCASKRDALSKVSDLVSEAKRLGQRAIAISDHGVLHAIPELYRECRKQGVKPIAAMEGYLTEDVNDPESKTNYHQLLIAINETGWKNLMRLSSEAYTHFHNRPRFDWAMMEKYSEGIIATSSCLSGVIPKAIINKDESPVRLLERYKRIFGDRFYLEIQPTPIPEQQLVNKDLVFLAERTGVPLVATGDVHYAKQEDYLAHQGVLALGWAKKLKHPDEPAYPCEEHYWMKPGELILEEFVSQGFDRETIITAINNTGVIVDRVDFDLKKEKDLLPEFELPKGYDDKNKLIGEMVKEGMMRKYKPVTKEVVERIKFELDVIREKGYVDYFLVVADAIKWCKEKGIIVNPRGSVGGSVVAYCLDITEIDSIKYELYFERFLDITRFKMPDVDLDCESARRGELLDYLRGKYDSDKVCQVTNYGRMTAKLAFKNACQVYDIPFKESKMITEIVDDAPKMTIEKARKLNPALVEFMDKSTEKFKQKDNDAYVTAREISWMAQKFEGVMDKLGKHAGGVLIASEPIANYFPTYLPDHLDKNTVVCQWDKDDLEELGGVKFDFLGLKTLGTVGLAIKSIKEEYGIDIDYREIMRTPDDPKVFELIATGKTQNMFQFGSNMMQNLCQRVKPNNIMDIVAINSLGRPAALGSGDTQRWIDIRNGLSEEVYSHPDEAQVTGETKGVIAYQEHVMRLVNVFAGWALGKGDSLRKKSVEELEAMRDEFVSDCFFNGHTSTQSQQSMNELWDRIIAYSGYGFNKAHAVEYSLMTYMSAWLELYYPAHWLAAVMTVKMADKEKVAQGLADIKANGFDFNPPDINKSELIFTAHNNKITFPLSVINGVGDKAVQAIIEARHSVVMTELNGDEHQYFGGELNPFVSLEDILSRIPKRTLNAKVMKGLIFAGAFDSLYPGLTRQMIYEDYIVIKGESKKKLEEVASQEWNDTVKANWEKDLLGVYISAHPLQKYHFRNWQEFSEGGQTLVGGIITKVKAFNDKKGNRMAFVSLDTYQGQREVVVFSSTYAKFESLLVVDSVVMIDGKKQNESLLANKIKPLEV
ncbi:DNA polymerase III subunit alpha [Bacillus toyonensis]|uniref:DNA polymerase III subunit alpha n=1 Tax=Bacillus toyonensis TaxID=155322 RepID=UPI000BF57790|nr:DNA polymerase III subunit alpha [Bacillus toyonensis]PGF00847.1 DNA polymerase III subunit alpha [Bacillus toyonensis]PHE47003.1 DNA polymerase III subunit alpha [Bacillus toyonensis]